MEFGIRILRLKLSYKLNFGPYQSNVIHVRFEVITAASMKIVAPCSLVEVTDVSEVLAASIIRAV
jgi:hypothetical protein